jgi:hypothetical protein
MVPLFLGLTLANLICLITAAVMGYVTALSNPILGQWHMLAGVLSAMVCVAVHCIVFTYFIATAKWVQHAVEVKRLDPHLTAPTRSFKAQAFPAALSAMAMVFLTAVLGAAVDNYGLSRSWHHALAISAIAANLAAALIEFAAIRRNAHLIDGILELINSTPASVSL